MDEVRVMIADDQPLVRSGLKAALEPVEGLTLVGEASDGTDAVRVVRRTMPDVVLMDIKMPRTSGLVATREICWSEGMPNTKVIILTVYDQDEHVFEALRAGASGFLLKDSPTDQVVQAIRVVADGEALLSPSVTRRLLAEFARTPVMRPNSLPELARLTERERDVFDLLVRGYRNESIAEALVVGESTVKSHVQHVYEKLGVTDRVQVVIFAYENGLLDPGGGLARA